MLLAELLGTDPDSEMVVELEEYLRESKHIAAHRQKDRWDARKLAAMPISKRREFRRLAGAALMAAALSNALSARLQTLMSAAERYQRAADAAKKLVAVGQVGGRRLPAYEITRLQQDAALNTQRFQATVETARRELQASYRKSLRDGMASRNVRVRAVSGEDKRWVDKAAAKEASFFDGVVQAVRKGQPAASLAPRIQMYGKAATSAFFAGQVLASGPNQKIHWEVDAAKENCPDCLELEARGPYTRSTLPTTPRAGDTVCLSNCGCSLIYEDATPEELEDLEGLDKPILLRRIAGSRKTSVAVRKRRR